MEKVKINKDSCIGCGACQAIAETVFEINDEGIAFSKEGSNIIDNMKSELKEEVACALEGCPTGAIYIENIEKED